MPHSERDEKCQTYRNGWRTTLTGKFSFEKRKPRMQECVQEVLELESGTNVRIECLGVWGPVQSVSEVDGGAEVEVQHDRELFTIRVPEVIEVCRESQDRLDDDRLGGALM